MHVNIILTSCVEEEARRRLSSTPPRSPQLPSPHQDHPQPQEYWSDLFHGSCDLVSPPPSPSCYSSSSEDEVLNESVAGFVEEMLYLELPSSPVTSTSITTDFNTTSPTNIMGLASPATPVPEVVVDMPTPMEEDIL